METDWKPCSLAMATLRYTCKYCGRPFRTSAGKKRHIQQTKPCLTLWREELGQFSINVFDLNDDDIPWHHGTVNVESDSDCAPDSIPDVDELDVNHDGLSDVVDNALGDATNTCQVDISESQGVRIEDIADEDGPTSDNVHYVEEFPGEGYAGAVYEKANTHFEEIKQAEASAGGHRWGPFSDDEEWGLAEWLIKNVGQKQMDVFLKLPIVSWPSLFVFDEVPTNNT
jgi:hypothetical protein